jgi:hypothetical protein
VVVAHNADASRGRSVSLSPAPGARNRSLSVGFRRGRTSVVKVAAESGVYDPAEVSSRSKTTPRDPRFFSQDDARANPQHQRV